MVKELEELTDRLEEASGATAAQMELNKKREMEVGRMRKDLEEASIQQESTMLSLRKKHQDAISEMSEQIEQLNKLKTRYMILNSQSTILCITKRIFFF